jgi:hypothetical protein
MKIKTERRGGLPENNVNAEVAFGDAFRCGSRSAHHFPKSQETTTWRHWKTSCTVHSMNPTSGPGET